MVAPPPDPHQGGRRSTTRAPAAT